MNSTPVIKKNNLRQRLPSAFVGGLVWGWCLSLGVSLFNWSTLGYPVALVRLQARQNLIAHVVQQVDHTLYARLLIHIDNRAMQVFQSFGKSAYHTEQTATGVSLTLPSYGLSKWLARARTLHHFLQRSWALMKRLGVLAGWVTLGCVRQLWGLLLAVPWLLLCLGLGVIDGMAMRYVRYQTLARESGWRFHRLLQRAPWGLKVWLALLMGLPVMLSPVWFFLSLGAFVFWIGQRRVSQFKKYV